MLVYNALPFSIASRRRIWANSSIEWSQNTRQSTAYCSNSINKMFITNNIAHIAQRGSTVDTDEQRTKNQTNKCRLSNLQRPGRMLVTGYPWPYIDDDNDNDDEEIDKIIAYILFMMFKIPAAQTGPFTTYWLTFCSRNSYEIRQRPNGRCRRRFGYKKNNSEYIYSHQRPDRSSCFSSH